MTAGRRAGPADRRFAHLDGEGRESSALHRGTATLGGPGRRTILGTDRALARLTETCRIDGGGTHENIYWLDASSQEVQSFQCVSPKIGHMQITALRDG